MIIINIPVNAKASSNKNSCIIKFLPLLWRYSCDFTAIPVKDSPSNNERMCVSKFNINPMISIVKNVAQVEQNIILSSLVDVAFKNV